MTVVLMAAALVASSARTDRRLDGFNIVVSPGHPFGSASARQSLTLAKKVGASAVAIVPFLWQAVPTSADIVRGSDMDDAGLRQAIRDARRLGLATIVKPQVWVDGSWAGAITLGTEGDWHAWFARYRAQLVRLARVAAEERADVFCVGTELSRTIERAEWASVIDAVRVNFPGELVYAAHNVEEAERVPFWDRLDAVGVTLYPPLGNDGDRSFRLAIMRGIVDRLDALAVRTGKPVIVGEIGIRSAQGAAAAPWQSAEEREAEADLALQADVLSDWLKSLDRPSIRGVLVWRWFTDPNAGGKTDTDFTVQNKPAERVLACAWLLRCDAD